MNKLLATLAVALLATGCSGTGMYDAPDAQSDVAEIKVVNHIDDSKQSDGADDGWQMPMSSSPSRAGVFKVDGDRTNEQGGGESALLKPGEHTIQVYADDAGILRFGDVTHEFQGQHKYAINVYSAPQGEDNYRAELVDVASPDKVLVKEAF